MIGRVGVHLLASRRGYRTVAASSEVTPAERAVLESLVFGQSSDPGYLASLEHEPAVFLRILPADETRGDAWAAGGRLALTRMFAGAPDEAGRATLELRTLLFDPHDYERMVHGPFSELLADERLWSRATFESGATMAPPASRLARAPRPSRSGIGRRELLMMDALLRVQETPSSTGVLADGDEARRTLIAFLQALDGADLRRCRWGMRILSLAVDAQIATAPPSLDRGRRHLIPIDLRAEPTHPAVAFLLSGSGALERLPPSDRLRGGALGAASGTSPWESLDAGAAHSAGPTGSEHEHARAEITRTRGARLRDIPIPPRGGDGAGAGAHADHDAVRPRWMPLLLLIGGISLLVGAVSLIILLSMGYLSKTPAPMQTPSPSQSPTTQPAPRDPSPTTRATQGGEHQASAPTPSTASPPAPPAESTSVAAPTPPEATKPDSSPPPPIDPAPPPPPETEPAATPPTTAPPTAPAPSLADRIRAERLAAKTAMAQLVDTTRALQKALDGPGGDRRWSDRFDRWSEEHCRLVLSALEAFDGTLRVQPAVWNSKALRALADPRAASAPPTCDEFVAQLPMAAGGAECASLLGTEAFRNALATRAGAVEALTRSGCSRNSVVAMQARTREIGDALRPFIGSGTKPDAVMLSGMSSRLRAAIAAGGARCSSSIDDATREELTDLLR